MGVPLNCHVVSAPEGIGQSMKTVIRKICIGGKKIPNLSHLQPFHLERWLPPAWNSYCITNTTLRLSISPARKTGMFSTMCWSSVCNAYLSTVTTAVMMLSATTCYWKSITAPWDHETLNSLGLGFFAWVLLCLFLKRVTYLDGDLNRRNSNYLAE